MTIKLKLQIVRKGTEYESYRITIPRALIEAHGLREKDFELKIKKGEIILTPVKKGK